MLHRRDFLMLGGATLLSGPLLYSALTSRRPIYGGWLKREDARRDFIAQNAKPFFKDFAQPIKGSSDGKAVLLWPTYEKVTKAKFSPFYQEIGDCAAEAGVLGSQFLAALQVGLQHRNEEYKGPFSVEYTYASSRVEVGGGKIRRGDGSTGAWVAESLRRYGLLRRDKYGQYDLTKYRPDLGQKWGKRGVGVPDELEPIGKEHPVKTVTLIESWEQAADSVANGFPVMIASSIGYNQETDRDGFLDHQGIVWYHVMLLVGIDRRRGKREGGCIQNSWGDLWLTGPKHELGTPSGGFWADSKNIDLAIREGDSFALSNYVGYPRRNLEYLLY